jgi:hypothetical protein
MVSRPEPKGQRRPKRTLTSGILTKQTREAGEQFERSRYDENGDGAAASRAEDRARL